jgi:hypothetical protein
MKLSLIRRILKEDLARQGEVPAWVDSLLNPLNDFINQVAIAFENNLTIKDNVLSKTLSLTFTSGTELEVNPQSSFKVFGILVPDASGKVVSGYGITSRKTNGNIGITINFASGGSSTCSVVLLYS